MYWRGKAITYTRRTVTMTLVKSFRENFIPSRDTTGVMPLKVGGVSHLSKYFTTPNTILWLINCVINCINRKLGLAVKAKLTRSLAVDCTQNNYNHYLKY